ncbi:MAG: glycosyltransferase family 4 protein [Dysgonomonas sp.]|nr:glycosyltransferase family 4 protein [Dysgonomonas sp.]
MDKIAIIVQRYSLEVNGGAELHARLLAEHLNTKYNVEVLTTCAKNYMTWEDFYPEGEDCINGVIVHRFSSKKKTGENIDLIHLDLSKDQKYTDQKLGINNLFSLPFKRFRYKRGRKSYEKFFALWMAEQGPLCKGLIDYIENNKDKYTAFIFFTYLYYPTYYGLQVDSVGNKSILIPTAHDEPPFYFRGYKTVFSQPKFFMYNTLSEKQLVEAVYHQTRMKKSDIAGLGFDKPILNLTIKKNIEFKYIVYIGRIEVNKGCYELVENFLAYKREYSNDLKLIMIGSNFLKDDTIEQSEDIIYTGFIDEQEKLYYLQNAEALVIPSQFESLSMVTLEAMIMGKPVLANEGSEVLKKHIEISNAGFLYNNRESFSNQLSKILKLSKEEKEKIAENGISYVENNYRWSDVIDKFTKAIDYIKRQYP